MIPAVYDANTLKFIQALPNTISCIRTVRANENYDEIVLTYPAGQSGSELLEVFNVIDLRANQYAYHYFYVIYNVTRNANIITVKAVDLSIFVLQRIIATQDVTGEGMIGLVNKIADIGNEWLGSSSPLSIMGMAGTVTGATRTIMPRKPASLLDLLSGKEGSVCDIYNKQLRLEITGEDGDFGISVDVENRVVNNNKHLVYGHEISGYTHEVDGLNKLDACTAYRTTEEDPEGDTDSGYESASAIGTPSYFCMSLGGVYDASDVYDSTGWGTGLSHEANKHLNENRLPEERYTITVSGAMNETVDLYEILNIWLPTRSTVIQASVVEYVYDTLKERYTSISIGAPRKTFARSIVRDTTRPFRKQI